MNDLKANSIFRGSSDRDSDNHAAVAKVTEMSPIAGTPTERCDDNDVADDDRLSRDHLQMSPQVGHLNVLLYSVGVNSILCIISIVFVLKVHQIQFQYSRRNTVLECFYDSR